MRATHILRDLSEIPTHGHKLATDPANLSAPDAGRAIAGAVGQMRARLPGI